MIVIRGFIWLIVIVIWAIVGFFFWISILARVISIASLHTIFFMLGNSKSKNFLFIPPFVINFYFNGFVSITNSVFNIESEDELDHDTEIDWLRVTLEIFWGLIFWIPTFYLLHKITDIGFIEGIWSEIRSVYNWVASFF